MKTRIIFYLLIMAVFVFAGSALAGLEGTSNTKYGTEAGNSAGDNDVSVFIGYRAGYNHETGGYDTFVGFEAGFTNIVGVDNTFIGYRAGYSSVGDGNTFIGSVAGKDNTTGNYNTFIGGYAGTNSTGNNNTFIGMGAGDDNTTGFNNTFIGMGVGDKNTTGYSNTFIGKDAGYNNGNAYFNTFIGRSAGYSNSEGIGNVFLGYRAGYNETSSNKLYIDNSNTGTPLIYGEFDNDILAVYGDLGLGMNNPSRVLDVYDAGDNARIAFHTDVTGSGIGNGSLIGPLQDGRFYLWNYENQDFWFGTNNLTRMIIKNNGYIGMGVSPSYPLHMASGARVTTGGTWQNASSRDYKENIKELSARKAAETLKGLNPVEFNYKVDKEESHVGFIAEDVPELVATKDRKGLSPMDIVAVLTKVVKEQQKVNEELQKTIFEMREEVKELKKEMKLKGSLAIFETEAY